jgi:hypothetical protein
LSLLVPKFFMEGRSLENGGKRIKFACIRTGEIDNALRLKHWDALHRLCQILVRLELLGATPVLPDGLIGGNGALRVGEHVLFVTPSGKRAGTVLTPMDFVLVESFSSTKWEAHYRSNTPNVRPSSDTPLLWNATLTDQRHAAVHGHALDSEHDAVALGCPISPHKTLFSTPEDCAALMGLLVDSNHQVYIRKGHGFFVLCRTMEECDSVCSTLIEPHIVRRKAKL